MEGVTHLVKDFSHDRWFIHGGHHLRWYIEAIPVGVSRASLIEVDIFGRGDIVESITNLVRGSHGRWFIYLEEMQ